MRILKGENLPPDRDLKPELAESERIATLCRSCSKWNDEKGSKQKYSSVTPFRPVNTCSLQTFRCNIGYVIHQYVGK